ncbi:hypothetical protein GCM10027051_29040 [Niabella terrae]
MITIRPKWNHDSQVLIIGGGPAGSGMAYHLARAGIKVLVVEAQTFPRDKVCGDGVSPIALAELQAMGITGTERFARANEIRNVGLFIKNDKVVIPLSKPDHLPLHARIIPRAELDHWIYEAAKKAGAVFIESARLKSYRLQEGGISAVIKDDSGERILTAKVLVGADGSRSAVARQLHGSKTASRYQLLGLRAYYEGVEGPSDRVDIFFSKESFPGIYWMFPKGTSGANIGMAMVAATLPHQPAHAQQLLQQHIAQNADISARIGGGQQQGKILGWPIGFFNPENPIIADRLLLAGDAAGLINPLSGDGIQYALLSARWAAEALVRCCQTDDFSVAGLAPYHQKIKSELAYDFAFSQLLVQCSRNKTLSTVWMEIIAVLIARAKQDPAYGDTVAGIFEGTYPSYKALSLPFILKSLLQAGNSGAATLRKMIENPQYGMQTGLQFSQSAINILDDLKTYPRLQGQWLGQLLKSTATVAAYTASSILQKAGKKAN